ncbi:MAG: ABC transporter ATP-binding protein, partial [Micromonosporaceae bacterium]
LLRCLTGLLPPTGGEVNLHGRRVVEPPQEMALVFQEYNRSLFPWMSVTRNVEMPLKKKIRNKSERARVASEALSAVGLDGAGDKYPWQLSGGMQQRVSIARAVAYRPEILVMDEPFASVDAQTRTELEDLLLRVRNEFNMTVLFVTHDIEEAVYLADRIVLLSSPPCDVQEVLDVPLPRPRDQVATKELPEYAHLRAHVYRAIKGER